MVRRVSPSRCGLDKAINEAMSAPRVFHVTKRGVGDIFLSGAQIDVMRNKGGVLDFGPGFYVFTDEKQAFLYCVCRARRELLTIKGTVTEKDIERVLEENVVVTFEATNSLDGFNVRRYIENRVWADKIRECRTEPTKDHNIPFADADIGIMASNEQSIACAQYAKGNVSRTELDEVLMHYDSDDLQIAVHAQPMADCLKTTGYRTLAELSKEHPEWLEEGPLLLRYDPEYGT